MILPPLVFPGCMYAQAESVGVLSHGQTPVQGIVILKAESAGALLAFLIQSVSHHA